MLYTICPPMILGDFYRIPEKSPKWWADKMHRACESKNQTLKIIRTLHSPDMQETHRWPFSFGTVLRKRLDHITYQPESLECLGCGVLTGFETGASDHQPVMARFVRSSGKQ